VVRDLLGGTEKVLDVGTGGDEKLVHLADAFGSARASTSTRRWSRQPARTFLSNCWPDRLSQRHTPIDRHAGFICRSGAQPALGC
jgi:hypothetical protein